jgi:hypothetical protein
MDISSSSSSSQSSEDQSLQSLLTTRSSENIFFHNSISADAAADIYMSDQYRSNKK